MGAGEEDAAAAWEKVEAKEERIMVSVRVRPLNGRESGDSSDWECISPTTVMFRSTVPDRAMFPTAYTYGKHKHLQTSILQRMYGNVGDNCCS